MIGLIYYALVIFGKPVVPARRAMAQNRQMRRMRRLFEVETAGENPPTNFGIRWFPLENGLH
jgi:hypothetical protein